MFNTFSVEIDYIDIGYQFVIMSIIVINMSIYYVYTTNCLSADNW